MLRGNNFDRVFEFFFQKFAVGKNLFYCAYIFSNYVSYLDLYLEITKKFHKLVKNKIDF